MPQNKNFVVEHDQLLKHLQISVQTAAPELARVVMPLTDHHRNGWGAAHGGVICALADAAFGVAANHNSKYAVVTVSTSIEFLRPGMAGPLKAEARAIHLGSRIVNYDVSVFDGDDQLIARGMLTGYITSRKISDES